MKEEQVVPELGNLVDEITKILTECKHHNPSAWVAMVHPDALMSTDSGVQRFLINRAFHMILGGVTTENTMDTRFCLVDTGDIKDWILLFRTGVAPTLVRLNLPN
jgi:hypothetical protein